MNKTFREIVKDVQMTDKDTAHSYGQWYDLWFDRLRDKKLNILEVGVCVFGGGCALSFAEYFKNSTIWAVDIDKKQCCKEIFTHPRIKFIEEDAYQTELLRHFENVKFDVIIDDADHECHNQIKLFKMLVPYLSEDGFYVIEDVCTQHWFPKIWELRETGWKHTLIDQSTSGCYDNCLIRFDKI